MPQKRESVSNKSHAQLSRVRKLSNIFFENFSTIGCKTALFDVLSERTFSSRCSLTITYPMIWIRSWRGSAQQGKRLRRDAPRPPVKAQRDLCELLSMTATRCPAVPSARKTACGGLYRKDSDRDNDIPVLFILRAAARDPRGGESPVRR